MEKTQEQELFDINIEQYNKEIDEAVTRVEAGEFYIHDEVAQMAKNW